MPARIGGWPGSPVIDINPDMPWAMASSPARSLQGPSCPKPEMLA